MTKTENDLKIDELTAKMDEANRLAIKCILLARRLDISDPEESDRIRAEGKSFSALADLYSHERGACITLGRKL